MAGIRRGFENMNLNQIGEEGEIGLEVKQNIRTQITAAQPEFNYEFIEGITEDDIVEFTDAIRKITRKIEKAYQICGNHGALNCGDDYKNYNKIRNTFQKLNDGIHEGRRYTSTLRSIISSMVALPEVIVIKPLDKPVGEKTFSKMCLNVAALLVIERHNWVQGYWNKKQKADFK